MTSINALPVDFGINRYLCGLLIKLDYFMMGTETSNSLATFVLLIFQENIVLHAVAVSYSDIPTPLLDNTGRLEINLVSMHVR